MTQIVCAKVMAQNIIWQAGYCRTM